MKINEKEFIWEECTLDFIRALLYLGYEPKGVEECCGGGKLYILRKEGGFTFRISTEGGNVEVSKGKSVVTTFALPQAGGIVESKVKIKEFTEEDRENMTSYDQIPTHKVKITLEIPV